MATETTLEGLTILVTRAPEQGKELQEQLESLGAQTIHIPTIKIVEPRDWQVVDEAISRLVDYDWLLLTSANAVDAFFERAGLLSDIQIAVVGAQTAQRVRQHGREPDLIPLEFRAEGLLNAFPTDLSGNRIVFPRAEVADETLPEMLRARGAKVDIVVVYRTESPKDGTNDLRELLKTNAIDCITLTSGSSFRNLIAMLDTPEPQNLLSYPAVAVIGPITRRAVLDIGLDVDVEADVATIPSLVAAIRRHFYKE